MGPDSGTNRALVRLTALRGIGTTAESFMIHQLHLRREEIHMLRVDLWDEDGNGELRRWRLRVLPAEGD
jgi:hypothetical protein